MNKKRFVITAALLLCLSLTACGEDIDLTDDPSLTNNISDSADASGTAAEETQLTSAKETSRTETSVSQTTDSTQSTESTAVTVSTVEAPPEESQVTTAAVTTAATTTTITATTTTTAAPIVTTTTAKPTPVVTTTTTAAPPVVTTTTTAAPPVVTTTDKDIDDFVGRYNQRLQEQWEKDFAEQVFKLTNEFRAEKGKPAYKKLDALNNAAVTRAWEILCDYRSDHKRPDGQSFTSVFAEYGIKYSQCGENIAAGQNTPESVVEAWKNSQSHRDNMLSDKYTYMGVGMYYSADTQYGYYWTQDFCSLQ